ncbi:MAG: hypothetical protein MI861_20770 [Pirellulales bacterium]|nr:hypothetical protein [Pirellulales bacterium]
MPKLMFVYWLEEDQLLEQTHQPERSTAADCVHHAGQPGGVLHRLAKRPTQPRQQHRCPAVIA